MIQGIVQMPSVHKLFSSRVKTDVYNFVGESGRIFYNEESGELRISDGHTPYGLPIYSSNQGSGSLVLDRYSEGGIPSTSPVVISSSGIGMGDGSVCRISGGIVQGSGSFNSSGDCQVGSYIVRGQYNSSNWEPLLLSGSNRIIVQPFQSIAFRIIIICRRVESSSNEGGVYSISGGIDRLGSTSSVRLIGVPSRVVYSEDNPIWDVRVRANPVYGSMDIEVLGEYSKLIRYVGHVQTVEVTGE